MTRGGTSADVLAVDLGKTGCRLTQEARPLGVAVTLLAGGLLSLTAGRTLR